MNFPDSIKSGFNNYLNCRDRASRSQYWYWTLFGLLAGFVCGLMDAILFGPDGAKLFGNVIGLALLLPGINVATRRLHDIDKSGWWQLIALTIIGLIPLIYWWCKKGDEGINRFGAPPGDAGRPRR